MSVSIYSLFGACFMIQTALEVRLSSLMLTHERPLRAPKPDPDAK